MIEFEFPTRTARVFVPRSAVLTVEVVVVAVWRYALKIVDPKRSCAGVITASL
jgi:hypothetical protein